MDIFDIVLSIVITFLSSSIAFASLIAGMKKYLHMPVRGGTLHKTGHSAVIWGVLLFICLEFIPFLIFLINPFKILILGTVLCSFLLAYKIDPFSTDTKLAN